MISSCLVFCSKVMDGHCNRQQRKITRGGVGCGGAASCKAVSDRMRERGRDIEGERERKRERERKSNPYKYISYYLYSIHTK